MSGPIRLALSLVLCAAPFHATHAQTVSDEPAIAPEPEEDLPSEKLFVQQGEDPPFKLLLERKAFPIGKNSTGGVKGSTINVNNSLLNKLAKTDRPIPKGIKIHTICHSVINRNDFNKWTRWYQEDGSTQIYRMFKDEHNVRNDRPDAGRVESYSGLSFSKGGGWHEWQGTYTIVKPHGCMIFQSKNNDNDWAVSIGMNDEGDIRLNHRRHQKDKTLAQGMVGKSFHLRVRDNGHDYQVYFNGEKVGEGHYARPTGKTNFRWGMYGKTFRHDAMIFVTGAHYE